MNMGGGMLLFGVCVEVSSSSWLEVPCGLSIIENGPLVFNCSKNSIAIECDKLFRFIYSNCCCRELKCGRN